MIRCERGETQQQNQLDQLNKWLGERDCETKEREIPPTTMKSYIKAIEKTAVASTQHMRGRLIKLRKSVVSEMRNFTKLYKALRSWKPNQNTDNLINYADLDVYLIFWAI